ncbi:MAG: VOC family protein [Actinomycetota bacterium]|jgi:predicted enzyme related to lactoylglutathione lyase|nr:VOC family protein [Actinomycetota bacterium]
MSERNGYIPGVPCWVDTSQPDPEAVLPFYSGLFGWEFEDMMPEGSESRYFVGHIRGGDVAAIASVPEGAPGVVAWNTYVWVGSADEAVKRASEAGGTILREPFDVMSAGRMAALADPEGAAFCVWQPNRHRGARVVNEHGALNFNNLVTRDIEGAKAFYGALFGWKALALPHGMMWALPGYGDHLEESTPGLRLQMAEMGAPEGFIDVVAGVNPIAKDDRQTPAHWRVVFAVDDVHAATANVGKLGGEVVAGPLDAPWTRVAVIKDPHGATFTISQFVFENKDLAGEPAVGK